MEMNRVAYGFVKSAGLFLLSALLLLTLPALAQKGPSYSIKGGRMYIQMIKKIGEPELEKFIRQYDLAELDLKNFIKTNRPDSLEKLGWKLELNNETGFIISKAFEAFDIGNNFEGIFPADRIATLFPRTGTNLAYGINKFRNKQAFALNGSEVSFFLRGHSKARRVMLAGSFNEWSPEALAMMKTDTGWIARVKLEPGKYWYKFIIDGEWNTDNDNLLKENDPEGNTNSVYYRPNTFFTLPGNAEARKVFVAGSFNNWKENELAMMRVAGGWQLPLYLAEGTHTYKFLVDGRWDSDRNNKERLPDGHGGYNSVIRLGTPHIFRLNGYENARQVTVAGSFNGWKGDELFMQKVGKGWELSYTLGGGNFEYKYVVDGKWITDPGNVLSSAGSGNSYLIVQPNYTFRLKGKKHAKRVSVAGDFNNWDPGAYAMVRDGDDWVFTVHLSPGKHLYKYVVDGEWIIDPNNKLWEQNEFDTGNSVIWMREKE